MRELNEVEVEQVGGGAFQLATGAIGSGLNAGFAGANYALTADNFSWGGFTSTVLTSAATGFLVGSGVAVAAAIPGAAVAGATMIGVGGIIQATSGVKGPRERNGGS